MDIAFEKPHMIDELTNTPNNNKEPLCSVCGAPATVQVERGQFLLCDNLACKTLHNIQLEALTIDMSVTTTFGSWPLLVWTLIH